MFTNDSCAPAYGMIWLFAELPSKCQFAWVRSSNHVIEGHEIDRMEVTSKTHCMHICELHSDCEAVEHHAASQVCVLKDAISGPGAKLSQSIGWELYESYCTGDIIVLSNACILLSNIIEFAM